MMRTTYTVLFLGSLVTMLILSGALAETNSPEAPDLSYQYKTTYTFPDYVNHWSDEKYDLWYGKWPTVYLNGWWELIRLNGTQNNPADDYGTRNGFFREGVDTAGWSRMFVPWSWNDNASEKPFRGVGWYRRTFRVPEEYKGKRLILKFFGVLYDAKVYLNGKELGRHEGYWVGKLLGNRSEHGAFEFDVTDQVRFGQADNLLAVRVYQPPETADVGGIWQPVQINVREPVYIDPILVNCDVAKQCIRVRAIFHNTTGQPQAVPLGAELGPWTSYRYQSPDTITAQKVDLGTVQLPAGESEKKFTIKLTDPKLWNWDRPNLYRLQLFAGKTDIGQARFGFRNITIRGVHFYLNGKKMWIPGDQLEGMSTKYGSFFPLNQDIFVPPDLPFLAQQYHNLTEWFQRYRGYNLRLIRAHSDCWPEPAFDVADEQGMLVFPELGHPKSIRLPNTNGQKSLQDELNAGRLAPEGYRQQVRRRMYAHWNHPSIWAYSLGNELYETTYTPYMCDMFAFLKKDVNVPFPVTQSGRFYYDRVGDAFTPIPDFYDDHIYWAWDGKWSRMEDTGAGLATYIKGRLDRPWFNGECFGMFEAWHYQFKFEDLRKDLPNIDRNLYTRLMNRTENDFGEAFRPLWHWAMRYTLMYGMRNFLLETERGNPGRAEYYKRTVETMRRWNQYVTGFATHRVWPPNPAAKTPFGAMMRQVNSPLYVCTNLYFRHHFIAGQKFGTDVYTFNDSLDDVKDITVNIDLLSPDNKSVFHKTLQYDKLAQGQKIVESLAWKIPADQPTGHYRLRLQLQQVGRDVVGNEYRVYILGPDGRRKIDAGDKRIALYTGSESHSLTADILYDLGVKYERIDDLRDVAKADVLILGANSFDEKLKEAGLFVRQWIVQGGKVLCLEQPKHLGTIPFAKEFRQEETAALCGDVIVPEHPIYAGLEPADWDMWDDDPAGKRQTARGVINTRMIQPLTPAVLTASGPYGGYHSHSKPSMVAAEVRIGKGVVLFSTANAVSRYDFDGVATRYVENLLHYTLATPWDGLNIPGYSIPVISGPELEEYDVAPLPLDKVVFVDLRKVAHRRIAGTRDGKPGMFDQGPDEGLADFPVGRQTFFGVPFDIINPDTNGGKSCVVLDTKGNGRFPQGGRPEEVVIPVHRNLKRIVFLVTSSWATADEKPAAEFVIRFAGGKGFFERETVPMMGNINVGDWWITQGLLPGAKIAWSSTAGNKPCPLGVWMFEWTNRQPEDKITEIRFRTGNTRTIPALIAITGESAEAK